MHELSPLPREQLMLAAIASAKRKVQVTSNRVGAVGWAKSLAGPEQAYAHQ
jgi:hypothetical protein